MKNKFYLRWTVLSALLPAASASAIDLQPGEVRAPRPDVNIVQLSYQYSERGARYSHGLKQPGNSEIMSAQYQVRLGRSFEVSGRPAFFYAQTPMGYVHPEGALARYEGDAGVGDTAFLLAIWPYANHRTQTYFGVGAYLIAPTGSYSKDRSFNMGENRYRAALQAGYQAPLADNLHAMAALDTLWSGENDDFGRNSDTLKQHALYSGQASLRYDATPAYSVAAGYFYSVGGETGVNGKSRDDATRVQRYQLTGIANYAFGRITLQYGGDLKTENGYIEDSRWILRYSRAF